MFWQVHCLSCRRVAERALCRSCWQQVSLFATPRHVGSWPLFAAAPYQGVLRQWLGQTKYHGRAPLARALGFYLGEWFARFQQPIQALVPIPLHQQRQRERGYNQALEMARGASEVLDVRVVQALKRVRPTPALHSLSARERADVLVDAFAPRGLSSLEAARGLIVLVDDICTTGTTLQLARKCFSPEASGVYLTLAHTEN